MMRRKIAGVIVCTLLIFTAVFSAVGTMIIDQNEDFLSLSPYNSSDGMCGITWDATLSFSEIGDAVDSAVFGEAPDACDGHNGGPAGNDGYDVMKPPAPPMLPYVRAWFDDGLDEPFDCLHGDYRQYPDTSKVWNLSVQWFPSDYQSPTDITISWDTTEINDSEYNAVTLYDVSGGVIAAYMLADASYTFTAVAMVPKSFQIICSIGDPPVFSDENPSDGSVDVPVTTSELTVAISNPGGGAFDWSIETIPDIGSISGVGEFDGTKSCPVSGLSESTVYSWYVNAIDIGTGATTSEVYTFTTPNDPPYTPSNPDPEDGAMDVSISVSLSWTGGDPDPDDIVTYDLYFGTSSMPPKVFSNQSGTTYVISYPLDYITTYYWKIVAWDNHGDSTAGPIWDFTTEANEPPYAPSNPHPPSGATNVSIDTNLSWTGGDPDGDPVTYDVYFGTITIPPQVSSNQSDTTYDPGTLDYETQYYWKIVAWDNHGASTEGPIWDFTTEPVPNEPPYEPSEPDPEDGAMDVSINTNLNWTGGDPDLEDTVTYDIWFGKYPIIEKVVSNQSNTTYDPGLLDYETQYCWKIVAWDNHGASTAGPTWTFTTEAEPVPDLECDGELRWDDVKPGSTVTGSFTVENVGDMGTLLDWEITEWPTWGTWTFTPESGNDLTPEDGPVTVQVEMVAPDEPEEEFDGEVKIVNSEDSDDYCTIPVFLSTCASIPDLDCDGDLDWKDVKPGSTVTGSFTVSNIGDPGSELDWEIESYPNWSGSTWTFTPSSGNDLTPEDDPFTVSVSVVAPDEPEEEFTGEVKIVNSEDPDDYCIISAKLVTPVNREFSSSSISGETYT